MTNKYTETDKKLVMLSMKHGCNYSSILIGYICNIVFIPVVKFGNEKAQRR